MTTPTRGRREPHGTQDRGAFARVGAQGVPIFAGSGWAAELEGDAVEVVELEKSEAGVDLDAVVGHSELVEDGGGGVQGVDIGDGRAEVVEADMVGGERFSGLSGGA